MQDCSVTEMSFREFSLDNGNAFFLFKLHTPELRHNGTPFTRVKLVHKSNRRFNQNRICRFKKQTKLETNVSDSKC